MPVTSLLAAHSALPEFTFASAETTYTDGDPCKCQSSPGERLEMLRKNGGGSPRASNKGSYVTAPVDIDTVPVKPSYTIVTFRKNVRPIKA